MNHWQPAKMDTAYFDEEPANVNEECEILIASGNISIRYQADDGWVTYSGTEKSNGHFVLECPNLNGKASLHCFENSRIFEGYWHEEGERGFWRITLQNQPSTE